MTLTHEQIDAMTDDELNEAVAVHVMGWRKGTTKCDGSEDDYPAWFDDCSYVTMPSLWRPATDANDAVRVLEKLHELELYWEISPGGDGDRFTRNIDFVITNRAGNRPELCVGCLDKPLPEAVCRAALHAVVDMGVGDE